MSGICGVWHLDQQTVDHGHLSGMVDGLARRGPDGSEIWNHGSVGFGHAMLLTTPESTVDAMPVRRRDGHVVLTADARLDNRTELISVLGARGRSPDEISDSQLILEAYERWGAACPGRLLGDFAFAVWDERRRVIVCARDHMGVKPFYYHRSGRLFAFASEIGALLRVPGIPRSINRGRIADFLMVDMEGIDKTSTFYRDIVRLPPAHVLTVCPRSLTTRPYWSVDESREVRRETNAEYVDVFRNVFTEAVRSRLRNVSGVGSMLSGGVDSSAVVGVARQLMLGAGSERLHTFSAVSPKAEKCQETHFISQVLGLGDVEAHTIRVDQLGLIRDDLRLLLTHSTEPFDLLMPMPLIQSMYIAARRRGIKVLLDGAASDVVTSVGNGYLSCLLRRARWKTAVAEAFATSRVWGPDSPGALLYAHSRTAFVPTWLRGLWQKARRRPGLEETLKGTAINPAFARRIGLLDRLRERAALRRATPWSHRVSHANTINQPFLTAALERYDRAASAYSVERRDPFCDKRLVELFVGLPWHQKVSEGWSKILLRRSMSAILPDEVRWRRTCDHLGWKFTCARMALEPDLLDSGRWGNMEEASEFLDMAKLQAAHRRYTIGEARQCDKALLWQAFALISWLSRADDPEPTVVGCPRATQSATAVSTRDSSAYAGASL